MPPRNWAQKLCYRVDKKLVALRVRGTGPDRRTFAGTGSVIWSSDGITLILTCGHTIEKALDSGKYIVSAGFWRPYDVEDSDSALMSQARNWIRAYPISDKVMAAAEFGLLYVLLDWPRTFKLCDQVQQGMDIAAASFARGNPWISVSTGNISSITCGYFDDNNLGKKIEYVVGVAGGSSGCPILNSRGRIVGVHSETSMELCGSFPTNLDQQYFESASFKYGLHVHAVHNLLGLVVRNFLGAYPPGCNSSNSYMKCIAEQIKNPSFKIDRSCIDPCPKRARTGHNLFSTFKNMSCLRVTSSVADESIILINKSPPEDHGGRKGV